MGGNLGMIIPTLIGQNRAAIQAQQKEDDEAVDQQVAMYNYILADPNAPPQLKDPAIQHTLDLVEEHGGKDVQDSLPQLGQILTNLSKQSIIQGHFQRTQDRLQKIRDAQGLKTSAMPDWMKDPNMQIESGASAAPPEAVVAGDMPVGPDLITLANLPQQRPAPPTPALAQPSPPAGASSQIVPWAPSLQALAGIPSSPPSPSQAESVTSNRPDTDVDRPILTRTPPPSQQPGRAMPSQPAGLSVPSQEPPHLSGLQRFLRGVGAFGAGMGGYSTWAHQKQAEIENTAAQQREIQQYNTRNQIIAQAEQAGQITPEQAQEARMANITGVRSNLAALTETPQMARLKGGQTIPVLRDRQGNYTTLAHQPIDPSTIEVVGTPAQVQAGAGGLTGQPGQVMAIDKALANAQENGLSAQQIEDLQALRKKAITPSAAQQELELSKGEARTIADMIERGEGDPSLSGLTRAGKQMVEALLSKDHFNYNQARLDQLAMQRRISAMNSERTITLLSRINFTAGSLNKMDNPEDPGNDLIGTLEQTFNELAPEVKGKYKGVNKAFMAAARAGLFEGTHPGSTSAAQLLTSQVAELQEELSAVYMGTGSPTDRGLDQATKILDSDWSAKTLRDAARLTRANLFTRQMSIRNAAQGLTEKQMPGTGEASRFNEDGLLKAERPGQRPTQSLVKMYVTAYGDRAIEELRKAGWGDGTAGGNQ